MIDNQILASILQPQIDFLVWLQGIRDNCPHAFNTSFLSLTKFGEIYIPTTICGIIYWCIDELAGIYLFTLLSTNMLIAHLAKMIACIYRPWILSDKISPLKEALPYAKGYSFPSGHTLMSTSFYGGIANIYRKPIIIIIATILIALVMFSRMWLGVHMPQDIIFGLIMGIILIFTTKPLITWCEKDKKNYFILLSIINAIAFFALIYISYFKQYPMDYINNKLIVNPESSKYTFICIYGYSLGIINGLLLCRSLFPFTTKNISNMTKIFRGVTGVILVKYCIDMLNYIFITGNKDYKFSLVIMFIMGFIITGIYPLIFKTIENTNLYKKLQDKLCKN